MSHSYDGYRKKMNFSIFYACNLLQKSYTIQRSKSPETYRVRKASADVTESVYVDMPMTHFLKPRRW